MIKNLRTMSLRVASLSLLMAFTISSQAQSEGLELNFNISTDSDNNVLIEAADENSDMRLAILDTGTDILIGRARNTTEISLTEMLNGPINNLTIVGSRSGDFIVLDSQLAIAGQRMPIRGDLNIDARNGNDSVVVSGVDVAGKASIRGRGQGDLIELLNVDLNELFIGGGPGFDTISIRNTMAFGRVAISGGTASDNCRIEASSFTGRLIIDIEQDCFQ